MKTLALDENWDLMLDESGNIAVVEGKKQLAQDVASVCRVFKGENTWDTEQGIPYKTQVIGRYPNISLLQAYISQEAKRIKGAENIRVIIKDFSDRTLFPDILITDEETGETIDV